MKRVLGAMAVGGLLGGVILTGTAGADPVRDRFNGRNCHGVATAGFASNDPEGIGNFVGGLNVRGLQLTTRAVCESLGTT
jgi:hypothetical protein